MDKEKIKVVGVLWDDAVGTKEAPLAIPTLTFGVIVSETNDDITIAQEIFADGDVRDRTTIGRKMIVRIYHLRTLVAPREFERYTLRKALVESVGDLSWNKAKRRAR